MPNNSSLAIAVAIANLLACVPTRSSPSVATSTPSHAVRDSASAKALDEAVVLDRETLVCAVLERNPGLAAAEAALQAAHAGAQRPVAADATRVDFAIAPASIGRDVPFGFVVEVGQSFRLGQRRLEREVATTGARSEAHRRDAVRNELARSAAALYDDHFELARALETNAEHRVLVTQLVEAATRRYAAGVGSAQDPLQAELELARVDQERIALETEQSVVAVRTNRLLHRPLDTPLPPAPDRLTDDAAPTDAARLRDEAIAARPELRAAQNDAELRTRSVALARRRFAPSLGATVSYNSMWADVEHRFMMGVGLMLPLQVASLRSGVAQAQAEARQAQRVVDSERDRVSAEVDEALARLSAAERIAKLHRERLIPTARERVEAARIGYESGANDLDVLIDAARELRSIELAAQQADAQVDRQRAELDWTTGRTPCARKAGTP